MFLLEMTETTTIPEALANTGLGMGTVFAVLILISFVIYLLKFVPMLLNRDRKRDEVQAQKAPVKKTEAAPAASSAKKEADKKAPAGDSQLVAVIAAAIAAQMTEETGVYVPADGLLIRSIKKRTIS